MDRVSFPPWQLAPFGDFTSINEAARRSGKSCALPCVQEERSSGR